jgi:transcriptional regulator with XRE-family HTH domain
MQDAVKGSARALARAKRSLAALARRASTVDIAARTGIHQSQVSRLLRGQFRRVSPNVRKLLEWSPQKKTLSIEKQAQEAVIRAALRTWDATPEGAQALVRLLRSVEALRRSQPK